MLRLLLFVALSSAAGADADSLTLLVNGDTSDWEYQTMNGIAETDYRAELDVDLRQPALIAVSNGGASGYTMKREIRLGDRPWLHFLWRVDRAGNKPDEKTRVGDDFAWRLYFVDKSGLRYRALNLVYAQRAAVGETWKSPYSGLVNDIRAHALAAGQETDGWRASSLNVAELWRRLFGDDGDIGMIGLMTDGDNAGVVMQARYGAIVLSDSPDSPFDFD